nr:hypothetical protein KS05_33105 [Rhizobium brockwellii]
MIDQQRHQFARFQRRRRQKIRHAADAQAAQHRASQCLHIVAGQDMVDPDLGLSSGKDERPILDLPAIGKAKSNPDMSGEVAWAGGRPLPF